MGIPGTSTVLSVGIAVPCEISRGTSYGICHGMIHGDIPWHVPDMARPMEISYFPGIPNARGKYDLIAYEVTQLPEVRRKCEEDSPMENPVKKSMGSVHMHAIPCVPRAPRPPQDAAKVR